MSMPLSLQDNLYTTLIRETVRYIDSGDLLREWRKHPSTAGFHSAYFVFATALAHTICTSQQLIESHYPGLNWPLSMADLASITKPVWDVVPQCMDVVFLCVDVVNQLRNPREEAPRAPPPSKSAPSAARERRRTGAPS
ncbi:hypothetical protein EXIGLDRAFT_833561 [Exidia glandulosa HHB12029]|uniref:Uncharacterized protein n=1 Tax=Exidia glandulosa HHB12029 TaxID=1314781 RepID=A0A165KK54_EXIGL|nr:hypothetical protein EXIGLDRAFT_833561 [Exidia glandulosa HHB12029]